MTPISVITMTNDILKVILIGTYENLPKILLYIKRSIIIQHKSVAAMEINEA